MRMRTYDHGMMKAAGCLAAMLLCLAWPVRAQVTEAVLHFDAGNQRYQQGDYRGALAAYEQALAGGYTSGRLYYNMGNAYYRLDELGQAIRYYEKARTLLPDDRALLHNLRVARSRTVDQFSRVPTPFWQVWWTHLTVAVGPWGYFGAGFFFYVAAVVLVGYRIRFGTRNPWHRRALSLSALVGGLLLVTAFAASVSAVAGATAVVVADVVDLRETPDEAAAPAMAVHEGLVLEVLRARGEWAEVRLPNGVVGWVNAGALAGI